MTDTLIRMPLGGAIASILGRKDHKGYRDVGQLMKIHDLYKMLGLTNSPMLYNYMSGKTKVIDPERALVILNKFNILIDKWKDTEELKRDAENTELSTQIAKEPIKDIIQEIVEIEANEDIYAVRRGLRRLIARYY